MVGSTKQRLDKPRPATLIGKGKAYQVRDEARRLGATTVFFDCELSPSQAKNLDKTLGEVDPNLLAADGGAVTRCGTWTRPRKRWVRRRRTASS